MKKNFLSVVGIIFITMLILTSCNLPNSQAANAPTLSTGTQPQTAVTPASLCANLYFPTAVGDTWNYSGTNNLVGVYTRIDTITTSNTDAFSQSITQSEVNYSVTYNCSQAGLASTNPIQQYAGALLSTPNAPVSVKVIRSTGISLPAGIKPGDTWQQTVDWDATSQQINTNGRFIFDYSAVGYENVTVPAGTYNALLINGTIQVELTVLHLLAGTYSTSTWWVADLGLVKSEGTSHVPGVDFTDSMQLTQFSPAP